jgi:hypothetical protein
MFAKLLAIASLATAVSAAATARRVACPDGVNTASNGIVSFEFLAAQSDLQLA